MAISDTAPFLLPPGQSGGAYGIPNAAALTPVADSGIAIAYNGGVPPYEVTIGTNGLLNGLASFNFNGGLVYANGATAQQAIINSGTGMNITNTTNSYTFAVAANTTAQNINVYNNGTLIVGSPATSLNLQAGNNTTITSAIVGGQATYTINAAIPTGIVDAPFVTYQDASGSLPNSFNLGTLASGYLYVTSAPGDEATFSTFVVTPISFESNSTVEGNFSTLNLVQGNGVAITTALDVPNSTIAYTFATTGSVASLYAADFGTNGQILSTTGTALEWIDNTGSAAISFESNGTAEGDFSTLNLVPGNGIAITPATNVPGSTISYTLATAGSVASLSTAGFGTTGQVLSTSGTAVEWIDSSGSVPSNYTLGSTNASFGLLNQTTFPGSGIQWAQKNVTFTAPIGSATLTIPFATISYNVPYIFSNVTLILGAGTSLANLGGYSAGNIQIAANSSGQSSTSSFQITPFANMITALYQPPLGTTTIPPIANITLSETSSAGITTLNLVVTSTGANFGPVNDVEAIVSYCYNSYITEETP